MLHHFTSLYKLLRLDRFVDDFIWWGSILIFLFGWRDGDVYICFFGHGVGDFWFGLVLLGIWGSRDRETCFFFPLSAQVGMKRSHCVLCHFWRLGWIRLGWVRIGIDGVSWEGGKGFDG